MARAWSVPQRGSYASLAAPWNASQQRFLAQAIAACRAEPQRFLLLAMAVLLAAVGAAVPHLDDESLATLLFLAGAGLTVLVWAPWHTPLPVASKSAARASKAVEQARFAELARRQQTIAALDLDRWAKLTSHMSHELRTPLNAVLGFSEMMSNEVFGPLGSNCYAAYARDIHASGRTLLKSAEDALAITALLTSPERHGPPQTCRLDTAVEDACAFARYDLALRASDVACEIAPDGGIIGDSQATRQMLINLLAEAAQNARAGATISLKTICRPDCVRLSIAVAASDLEPVSQQEGFPMILARTLCDLSGARLTRTSSSEGGCEWIVDFLPVAQNDLFYRAG